MSNGHLPLALAVSRDRVTLTVASKMLADLGYEVEAVTSGTDAIRRIKDGRCDVVVATFGAPPMNGYGLWALLSGMPRLADVPFVLALTPIERMRLLAERRDMPATIEIPFTTQGLAGAIERARRGELIDVFEI
jgi:CheY-like chemotaxis protein